MPFRCLTLATLSLLASPAFAAASHRQAPPADFASRTLRNGTLVVVRADRSVPAVAVTTVVGAGAVDESPERSGASHFLEHLLFNGTATRTQEQLYAETDRLGLYSNAFTRREYTAFQMLGRADRLDPMLDLMSDMLFRSTMPAEKFEKERGIILEEIAQDASRGAGGSREAFERELLGALPATGTPETVKAMPRDAVFAYWQERYVPANMVVLVNGDITPEAAFRAVERAFTARASARAGAVRRPPLSLAFRERGAAAQHVSLREGDTATAWLAFAAPSPEAPLFPVAMTLLRALEESLGAAEQGKGASAWIESTPRSPLFVVEVAAQEGESLEGARARVEAWLAGEFPGTLDDATLERAAHALSSEERLQAEQPHYYAFYRAELLQARAVATLSRMRGLSLSTSAAEVRAMASAMFTGPRLVIVATPPGVVSGETVAVETPETTTTPAALSDAAGPRSVLANGVVLITETAPDSSVFAAAILLRDKQGHEARAGLPGAAEILHRTFMAGTRLRSRTMLAEDLASMGAELKVVDDANLPFDDYYLSAEYGYLRFKAPVDAAGAGLRLMAEVLAVPKLDDESVAAARSEAAAAVRAGARTGRELAELRFEREVLGGRGWPSRGASAVIEATDAARLAPFARSYTSGGNVILSVVSPFSHAEVHRLATAEFRALSSTPALAGEDGGGSPGEDQPPPGLPQSRLILGQELAGVEGASAALTAATAYLSDLVAQDVRERQGLAYSIGASSHAGSAERPAWFRVSLGTRPENVDKAQAAVRRVITEALARPFDEAAFAASVQKQAGRLLMRRLSSENRAFQAAADELHGKAPGEGQRALDALFSANATEAASTARRLLNPTTWQLIAVP